MSEFPAAPDSVRTATFELRALSRSRAGRQQAEVEVRWNERSGARGRHVLLLERARTPPPASRRRGLATSRCEACLGPIARTDLERCGFCGADFEAAWRLDAVVPFESWSKEQVGRLQTSSAVGHATGTTLSNLSQVDREAVLEAAVAVTFADGAIVDAERATLLALTARLGLPAQALEAAIERKPSPAFVKGRWTRHQGEAVILALVELVFVDGRAEPAERRVVRRLADSIDLGERFERALNERIRELMAKGLSGQ